MRNPGLVALGLAGAIGVLAACSEVSPRGTMPRLRGEPSEDRPPWLRDLPQPLERYPAPEGWGGDHLAALHIAGGAGHS